MKNRPIGIHTGFDDLDYQGDGGLKKSDTYLIAAGWAMGKIYVHYLLR